jgi:hypothetical protein
VFSLALHPGPIVKERNGSWMDIRIAKCDLAVRPMVNWNHRHAVVPNVPAIVPNVPADLPAVLPAHVPAVLSAVLPAVLPAHVQAVRPAGAATAVAACADKLRKKKETAKQKETAKNAEKKAKKTTTVRKSKPVNSANI